MSVELYFSLREITDLLPCRPLRSRQTDAVTIFVGIMDVAANDVLLVGAIAVSPGSMKTISFVVRIGRPIVIREMCDSAVAAPWLRASMKCAIQGGALNVSRFE